MNKRITWIDCAKGIAILLTIIGHSVSEGVLGGGVRGMIFSFHMPLFFIMSCITYKLSTSDKQWKDKTVKAATHLLIPAFVVMAILIGYGIITHPGIWKDTWFWKEKVYTIIYASGVENVVNGNLIPPMGIPWFFFALFVSRTLFDYIHLAFQDEKQLMVISGVIGVIGVIFGQMQQLPFSLDIAMAVFPFLYVGHYLQTKGFGEKPIRYLLISTIIWGSTLLLTFTDFNSKTYMELACRRYPMFPICYVTALAGTVMIGEISVLICKFKLISKPLVFIGKNSLYVLCVHAVDSIFSFLYAGGQNQFIFALKRTAVDVAIGTFLVALFWARGTLFRRPEGHSCSK